MTVFRGSRFLQDTYKEAEKLQKIAKEYFEGHAIEEMSKIHAEARFAYKMAMSNVNAKLAATIEFINCLNKINCSQVTREEKKSQLGQFINVGIKDDEYHGYFSKLLLQLWHASDKIYNRVEQLYSTIQSDISVNTNDSVVVWGERNVHRLKLRNKESNRKYAG